MQKNGGGWVQTNDSPLQFLAIFSFEILIFKGVPVAVL